MTAVDPSLFEITPSPQDLLAEAQIGANLLGGEVPSAGSGAAAPHESPAELGDDALVDFTSAAQNWFNTEQQDGVPDSVISVQSMLSTLVGSMTANATEAFATAAEMDPHAALSLTQV
ncbi:MAG TPA: hypothetical protein VG293_01855 [Solirubrobacteraceae bacterium]|jgi:hypothetical protein|nr:hypothetical protein [Solirubrobacteraceae bacterium]